MSAAAPPHLLHLIERSGWHSALAAGSVPLAPEGFVHLSTVEQVRTTANRYYAAADDLLLLGVRTDVVEPALRWEESHPGELFPHVHSTIPVGAVVSVVWFPPPFDLPPAVQSLGAGSGVRPARAEADATAITAIGDVADGRRAAGPVEAPAPERVARYRELLGEPGGRALVYEEQGRLLAAVVMVPTRAEFGRGDPVPGRAHLSSVATHPDAQGRGLASLLLQQLCADLFSDGYERVGLWAHDDNRRARRLYERLGWCRSDLPPGAGADGAGMVHYERNVAV